MNKLQKFEKENKERMDFLLQSHNPGHDEIQMRYFIVGNGLTDYGKYKQARAEFFSHYSALTESYFLKEKTVLEIEILEEEKAELQGAKARLKEVEIAQKKASLVSIEKAIDRSLNELNMMFKLANEYYEKIKDKDEKKLIEEFHIERLKKMVALNTIYHGGNLSGVMDAATTLPLHMQEPVLDSYHAIQVTEMRNRNQYLNEAISTALIGTEPITTPPTSIEDL